MTTTASAEPAGDLSIKKRAGFSPAREETSVAKDNLLEHGEFCNDSERCVACELAKAVRGIGIQLKYLGTGDAGSTMGALEFLAVQIGEALRGGAGQIADAIRQAAEIMAEGQAERQQRAFHKPADERSLPDVAALLAEKVGELRARN